MDTDFDLIVLGAGSGGLAAAKRAASYGFRVAVVEGDRVGGTCVIRGCVPKKLLVYGSLYSEYIENASNFGVDFKDWSINSAILLSNIREEVDRLNALHINLLKNAGVELIQGWGKFVNPHTILVLSSDREKPLMEIKAKRILIAVGGRPIRPSIPGSELGLVSDDMFIQKKFPQKFVVVGGGFIACEFASILNGLGVKVTQLVRGKHLLRGFDRELSDELQKDMQMKGIEILFNQNPVEIKGKIGDLNIISNVNDHISCEAVLFAIGREPFLEGLDLPAAGVQSVDMRIIVDKNLTTNIPHIFAVGDVTDRFKLTPVAIDQGRAFADTLFGNKPRDVNYKLIPTAVFSQPEIATVGLTEEEAISLYGEKIVKVFRARFRSMSKALTQSQQKCLLKLIVDTKTDKIIGCHMIGEHAAEIIQMASIAITMGAKKSDFDKTMALHPTISEEFVTMV